MKNVLRAAIAAALVAAPLAVHAGPHDAQIRNVIETNVKNWLSDPVVIESIKAQNNKHGGLSQTDIDTMDKQWRAETKSGSGQLIGEVLANSLSAHLKGVKQGSSGLFTEIFIMDNKGLNVGQSDVTSDYWQGDEAKWKNTFLAGAGAVFIDEVEFDESTQQYQVQTSVAISDPATQEVIGAVTIGVNVEMLQ